MVTETQADYLGFVKVLFCTDNFVLLNIYKGIQSRLLHSEQHGDKKYMTGLQRNGEPKLRVLKKVTC